MSQGKSLKVGHTEEKLCLRNLVLVCQHLVLPLMRGILSPFLLCQECLDRLG